MTIVWFGWARAVPINPGNFKHFRRDTAITALAGPVANVLITALALLLHSTTIGVYLRWDRPQWLLAHLGLTLAGGLLLVWAGARLAEALRPG